MKQSRLLYLMHAELQGKADISDAFDDESAGRPIGRRLNRIERVVNAYRGRIDERLKKGMRIAFKSADAAFLAACEMQHRCMALPQLSGNWLSLRIGIHQSRVLQRARDGIDNAQEIAAKLATLNDGIVFSEEVFNNINPALRKISRQQSLPVSGIKTYCADWRSEIPSTAYGGESLWPDESFAIPSRSPGTYLVLYHGLKKIELTHDNPVATIGRSPKCDLVIVDDRISRNHCRIEHQSDLIMLSDSSTNGTCILPDGEKPVLVKGKSVPLTGKGLLFFGRSFDGERRGGIRYEAY